MTAKQWFVLAIAFFVVVLLIGYLVAPDEIPLHYGLSGEADRVGTPERWLVENGLLGLLLTLLLGGLARWGRRMSIDKINVPHKEYWSRPENQPRLRAMLTSDLYGLAAWVVLMLGLFSVSTVMAARDGSLSLTPMFWGVLATLAGGILLWALWLMPRRYAPSDE